jgi:PAS domain S-box-containing protein
MNNRGNELFSSKKQAVLLLIIISAFVVAAGYFYYHNEIETVRHLKKNELQAIIESKSNDISDWYLDELADANTITENEFLREILDQQQIGKENKTRLNRFLDEIKTEHGYYDIILTDLPGNVITSTTGITELEHPLPERLRQSLSKNQVISTDLYISKSNSVQIGFISPIKDKNKRAFAALIYLFDADKVFFPLVNRWPVSSESAEIVLTEIRRNRIIYLNKLRFKNNEPFEYALPITMKELPEARSISGYTGIVDGTDYRNVKVYAYVSPVPSTPWFITAKVDYSELLKDSIFELLMIVFITIMIIFGTGALLFYIYNNKQRTIYQELYKKEKDLWQATEMFKVTLDSLGDGVITADITGKIQYMNNMAKTLTGWSLREAKGHYISEVYSVKNELTGEKENNIVEKVFKHGIIKELANHTILVSKTGKEIPVMDTGAPIFDSDGTVNGLVLTFQDETEKRQHLNEIAKSEERFRSSLDNLIEGCQIIGFDETYHYINVVAEKHIGIEKDKLLGKHITEIWGNAGNAEIFSKTKECLTDRQKKVFETLFEYSDGTQKWYDLKIYAVPEGVFILSYDITDKKAAEEEQKKLSMAVVQSPVSVIIANTDGIIDYTNPNFSIVTGYSAEEIKGKPVSVLRSGNHPEDFIKNIWSIILSGESWKGEMQRKKKNGELYWDRSTVSPVIDDNGKITFFVEISEDVTERKKMLNDLIIAKEKAEELNKIKTNFFASMSHELRTPFVGIMGYAELLSDRLTSPETKAMATGILDTSKRMKETLTKILNISKFEFNGIDAVFKEEDTAKIIHSIFDSYQATANKKGLKYELKMNFTTLKMVTDASLFGEIINNLINNAILYTNKGSVNVFADRQILNNTDTLVIKVADTGIGIPKEKFNVVWEEFRQVSEGYTRKYQGTGLGLAIVKKYTNLLNGNIYFESEYKEGTTFTLELPVTGNNPG